MNIEEALLYLKDMAFKLQFKTRERYETLQVTWEQLPELLAMDIATLKDQQFYWSRFDTYNLEPVHYSCIRSCLEQLPTSDLTEDEYIAFAELVKETTHLNEFANDIWIFRDRNFHSDLPPTDLAEIVLFIFNKGSRRLDDYASYIAQLQQNPREMIRLLGLTENDYDLLWKEIIKPTLIHGDLYYDVLVIPVLELLVRKRTLDEMKLQQELASLGETK